jgi:hypothetical protein
MAASLHFNRASLRNLDFSVAAGQPLGISDDLALSATEESRQP